MTKRLLAALLAAIIVFCLTACAGNQNEKTTTSAPASETASAVSVDVSGFKLSYSKSDSLNPFSSTTLNNQVLSTLVFESLFIIDESHEAEPLLTESYKYTDSETLRVKLKKGIRFSNGDKLTAENVVYSFDRAAESPRWKNALSAFSSASQVNSYEVKFKLKRPNPEAHKLLTFAVAKKDADKNGFPVGSGRYKFGEGGGMVYLKVNKKYHEEFTPHFSKIILINITAEESIENAVNIGNISYTFRDMSKGSKVKMHCSKKPVGLNNMVYIGINGYRGITRNAYIRKAIALAVDRETIVKSAYRGYAKEALSVFNPDCALGKSTQIFSRSADVEGAKQAIEQSKIEQSELTLDILTSATEGKSETAQLLKQQLEAAGFKVTINKEKPGSYINKVNNNSFNIYIGETKLTNDMSLNSFFLSSGATKAGIDLEESKCAESYEGYLKGDNEIGKFVLDFSQELPFIPLVYRQGMICYSHSLRGDMQGYTDNYFSNIEDWYFN